MDVTSHVIVFGGRDFSDYPLLCEKLDQYTADLGDLVVVSGAARGADALGERWAHDKGFRVKRFPADWVKHGKKAGPIRNGEMVDFVYELLNGFAVGFHDGVSRGTADMIRRCQQIGIPLKVVHYKGDWA